MRDNSDISLYALRLLLPVCKQNKRIHYIFESCPQNIFFSILKENFIGIYLGLSVFDSHLSLNFPHMSAN